MITYTYIIGHYNASVRILDLVSLTTYVACVYWLRTTDFLRNFSWQFYLLSEFFLEIYWDVIAKEILFVFCFDVWPGARTVALRLISQHTIYKTTVTRSFLVYIYIYIYNNMYVYKNHRDKSLHIPLYVNFFSVIVHT